MVELNGSISIWCAIGQSTDRTSMEAHFNYWRFAFRDRQKGKFDFFEIGILLTNPANATSVYIYIPTLTFETTIMDVGSKFEETDIAQGIFNQGLQSNKPYFGASYVDLIDQNSVRFCRVHKFAADSSGISNRELTVAAKANGTLISITPHAIALSSDRLASADRLYFRLRFTLANEKNNPFVKVINPNDRLFQSGFDQVEYLDFRLNESRSLPDEIERQRQADMKSGYAVIDLVAFLTAIPVVSELSLSNTAHHKSRLLEERVWNKYAPFVLPQGMIVYHWKEQGGKDKGIESFSAFVKMRSRAVTKWTIVKYLAVAFFLVLVGNIVATYLQPHLPWLSTNVDVSPNDPRSTRFLQFRPESFGPPWPGQNQQGEKPGTHTPR